MYGKQLERDDYYIDHFFKDFGIRVDPIYNSRSIRYYYEKKIKSCLIINTRGVINL